MRFYVSEIPANVCTISAVEKDEHFIRVCDLLETGAQVYMMCEQRKAAMVRHCSLGATSAHTTFSPNEQVLLIRA
jgi:hypothetical protein